MAYAFIYLGIVVLFVIFGREINAWFWKTNEVLKLLREISNKLNREEK